MQNDSESRDLRDPAVDRVKGHVDQATREAIEAHLDQCPACASRLGLQRAVCNFLESTSLAEPPADLEDDVLGEVLFPKKSSQVDTPEKPRAASWWHSRWRGTFKAWIPAAVGVVAVLAAITGYGLLHGSQLGGGQVTTTASAALAPSAATEGYGPETNQDSAAMAVTSTTAGALTTTTGGQLSATGPGAGGSGGPGEVTTTAAAGTTAAPATTAPAPSTTATLAATATTTEIIRDSKQMVSELKTAGGPVYFVFEPASLADKEAAPTATSADLASQIAQLTGLQPLDPSLDIQGTTFAAYVPRTQASQLVDLLRSIASSLDLTVELALAPVDVSAARTGIEYGAILRQKPAEIPELHANRTPQPAVSDWTFTTSTLLPADEAASPPPDWQAPDEDGSHVLVVIYLGL
jgi:hypothetical protein